MVEVPSARTFIAIRFLPLPSIVATPNPDTLAVISAGYTIRYSEAGKPIFLVINADELHNLVRVIFIEGQAAAGIDYFTSSVASPTENQSAILATLIVVEQHSRLRSPKWLLFAANDDAR